MSGERTGCDGRLESVSLLWEESQDAQTIEFTVSCGGMSEHKVSWSQSVCAFLEGTRCNRSMEQEGKLLGFIIGFMMGSLFGVITLALAQAASDDDDR